MASATTFYDFSPRDAKNEEVSLSKYKGKVVLVVNVASKCGFTKQYKGLQELYTSMNETHPDDFVVLGFPCNQFGGQEPGTIEEIQAMSCDIFAVTFPTMQKVEVKGDKADPLFKWLTSAKRNWGMESIKWNFEKFLISRDGNVKERWSSITEPTSLKSAVLAELEKKAPQPTSTAAEPAPVPTADPQA